MLEHWIWLATRQRLNKRIQSQLLRSFGNPEQVYDASRETLQEVPGITAKALEALADKSLTQTQQIIGKCRRKGIGCLTMADPNYPQQLLGIQDPPLVLYYLGTLPDWETRPVIGAVGTRSCSDYGLRAGEKLGYELSRCGAVVTSGLAEGVDTAVLTGVLSAEGTPVVFLAGIWLLPHPVRSSIIHNTSAVILLFIIHLTQSSAERLSCFDTMISKFPLRSRMRSIICFSLAASFSVT